MGKNFLEQEKQALVTRYQHGESVQALCRESGASKSSLYEWIKRYRGIWSQTGQIVTPQEFDHLKRRAEKLENIVTVLKKVYHTDTEPTQTKLLALEKLYGQYSVHVLCEALDVPRGTLYNHLFRNKRSNSAMAQRREELRIQIREIFEENRQLFGAGKIRAILMEHGHRVSEKLVAELMREMGLVSIRTSSKRDYTRLEGYEKKRNILQRRFRTERPNQVWVSDVTCFKLKGRWYYICAIIDLFSRRVVAYGISQKNSTRLITSTFKSACAQHKPGKGLIFHSDQGAQYTAYSFQKLLREHGITQSFSNPGTPHDNAVAEAFFSTLKKEELYRTNYRSESEFKAHVTAYMEFYNERRPHQALRYKTPAQVECAYTERMEPG